MGEAGNVKLGFEVEVVHGDAFTYPADVLAAKDAPLSGGLDAQLRKRLKKQNLLDDSKSFLSEGEYRLLPGEHVTNTKHILLVGSPSIFELHYAQLRELGQHFLESLWQAGADVEHLLMTAHGVKTALALDEEEAFRALLLGMADACESGHYPPTLQRVTFVELSQQRVQLFQDALLRYLAPPSVIEDERLSPSGETRFKEAAAEMAQVISGPESFQPEFRTPTADDTTPFVFVAMPFREDYDDQFYLAIQPSIKERGLLCERMDLDKFTGDITDRMFTRIQSAKLVVALLDGGNPNVYLEVGYAWGVKTQTVLIAHKEEALPFDVRGHRVLIYDRIYKLKEMLNEELARLL